LKRHLYSKKKKRSMKGDDGRRTADFFSPGKRSRTEYEMTKNRHHRMPARKKNRLSSATQETHKRQTESSPVTREKKEAQKKAGGIDEERAEKKKKWGGGKSPQQEGRIMIDLLKHVKENSKPPSLIRARKAQRLKKRYCGRREKTPVLYFGEKEESFPQQVSAKSNPTCSTRQIFPHGTAGRHRAGGRKTGGVRRGERDSFDPLAENRKVCLGLARST